MIARFKGNHDAYDGICARGWAWDTKHPARRVAVVILRNGVPAAIAVADRLRPDLRDAGIGDGRYGYEIALAAEAGDVISASIVESEQALPGRRASAETVASAPELLATASRMQWADDPLPQVPLVESPFFEQRLAALGLPPAVREQARFYRENGYLVIDFEDAEFAARAARVVANLAERQGESVRLQDAWRFDADVRAIACNGPVMRLLGQLYGREPFPFQTLNFRAGSQQPLHSDSVHFNSMPEKYMCGVWLAFEDVDGDNGPLCYAPGSHRLPVFKYEDIGVVGSEQPRHYESTAFGRLWQELPEAHGLKRVTFHARKGQALIWAANLLHGGAPQNDPRRSRHSQVTHYYFEGCAYWTPLESDPFFGRIRYREPTDIRSGRKIANIYGGRQIPRSVLSAFDPGAGINGSSGA